MALLTELLATARRCQPRQGRHLCRSGADRDPRAPSAAISCSTHRIRPKHRMTNMGPCGALPCLHRKLTVETVG